MKEQSGNSKNNIGYVYFMTEKDLFGNPLRVSEEAIADELASAASLLQGQANEALPVVLIRGFQKQTPSIPASGLIRPNETDLFQ